VSDDSPQQVEVAQQLLAATLWFKEALFCCFQDGYAQWNLC